MLHTPCCDMGRLHEVDAVDELQREEPVAASGSGTGVEHAASFLVVARLLVECGTDSFKMNLNDRVKHLFLVAWVFDLVHHGTLST